MMKGLWPFGAALRGEASNHLMLRWLMTVVVSDGEKAPVKVSGGVREGERERTAVDVSKLIVGDIETGVVQRSRDEPGGCPLIGQAVSGMEAARARTAALARNVGRRAANTAAPRWGGERERPEAETEGTEYRRAACWRTGS